VQETLLELFYCYLLEQQLLLLLVPLLLQELLLLLLLKTPATHVAAPCFHKALSGCPRASPPCFDSQA
jgi:hypothetical protein